MGLVVFYKFEDAIYSVQNIFWIIQFKIFLTAIIISFLPHELFSNVWGYFGYLLILISNLITVWLYTILNDFNSFKYVEIYFMTQYMISLGNIPHTCENNAVTLLKAVLHICWLGVSKKEIWSKKQKLERCDCWNVPQPRNGHGL